jgi:hypothetical protein
MFYNKTMKYLSVRTIVASLHRVHQGNNKEHVTGTPATGLLVNYFPQDRYAITPEQIQISNRKPDLSVELLNDNDELVPHVFVELKSLVNSNFNDIMDQLYDTVLETVDTGDTDFAVYVIAMKGAKIAMFEFHSYVSLLDEYNIMNYKGFIPMTYRMPGESFFEINHEQGNSNLINFLKYRCEFSDSKSHLETLGVESTSKIKYPHILDLLNKDHEGYVHDLFKRMAENKPGKSIS